MIFELELKAFERESKFFVFLFEKYVGRISINECLFPFLKITHYFDIAIPIECLVEFGYDDGFGY